MSNSVYPFNGYAPGNYSNLCKSCKSEMQRVDKLCFICLPCAIRGANDQIDQLKQWKTEAMEVMAPMQEIGKAIGIKPGQSVHDKILPAIERLTLQLGLAEGRNREHIEEIKELRDALVQLLDTRNFIAWKNKYQTLLKKLYP